MKGRALFALLALALALGCEDQRQPTGPRAPTQVSAAISDGAHGGNRGFFFLPPLVPLNGEDREFEFGKFNDKLQPSLTVEICELNTDELPTKSTQCVAGDFVKLFGPGEVVLVNLPAREHDAHDFPRELDPEEWWGRHKDAPEGFYYVLWNTSESNLDVDKFYRIAVRIDGADSPLGFVDVDPMSEGHGWRYSRSGQIVKMVDDVKLPIPFRVERGALCERGRLCNSVTVTNFTSDPPGFQLVTLDRGAGAIAGARFPNGWLPPEEGCPFQAGCPQTVVVTISSVNTGVNNRALGSQSKPCHDDIPFEQFDGCFKFTTTPELAPLNEGGDQFVKDVTVAACYVLQGTGDPREVFAQMYASGPREQTRALPDVTDEGILAPSTSVRRCGPNYVGLRSSNPFMQFASTGWRKLSGLFEVNTAYAVDQGLGGLVKKFSNIGAALSADIQSRSNTHVNLPINGVTSITSRVRIVGTHLHSEGDPGVNGVWVTFSVTPGNGTLRRVGTTGGGSRQITVFTSHLTITEAFNDNGMASVIWTPPAGFGSWTMTATGPATGSPVTFHAFRGD